MKREKLEQIIMEELINEGLMDIIKSPSRWFMTSDDETLEASGKDLADESNVRSWSGKRKKMAVRNFKKHMSNQAIPELRQALDHAKDISVSLDMPKYQPIADKIYRELATFSNRWLDELFPPRKYGRTGEIGKAGDEERPWPSWMEKKPEAKEASLQEVEDSVFAGVSAGDGKPDKDTTPKDDKSELSTKDATLENEVQELVKKLKDFQDTVSREYMRSGLYYFAKESEDGSLGQRISQYYKKTIGPELIEPMMADLQQKLKSGKVEIDTPIEDDKKEKGKDDQKSSKASISPEEPIALFKGQGALYQRLQSTLAARLGKNAKSKEYQELVQPVIMDILKDLSAQLRANNVKVQESIIAKALLEVLNREKSLLLEKGDPSKFAPAGAPEAEETGEAEEEAPTAEPEQPAAEEEKEDENKDSEIAAAVEKEVNKLGSVMQKYKKLYADAVEFLKAYPDSFEADDEALEYAMDVISENKNSRQRIAGNVKAGKWGLAAREAIQGLEKMVKQLGIYRKQLSGGQGNVKGLAALINAFKTDYEAAAAVEDGYISKDEPQAPEEASAELQSAEQESDAEQQEIESGESSPEEEPAAEDAKVTPADIEALAQAPDLDAFGKMYNSLIDKAGVERAGRGQAGITPWHDLMKIMVGDSPVEAARNITRFGQESIEHRQHFLNLAKKVMADKEDAAKLKADYAPGGAKAAGAGTDSRGRATSGTGGRVKPEKGIVQVGRAAGGKLKGMAGGGLIDQDTINQVITKVMKPYIYKQLKARGLSDIKIAESVVKELQKRELLK